MSDSFLPYVNAGTAGAAAAILPFTATVLTAARFYVRKKDDQRIRTDDWLLIPAVLCYWGMGSIVLNGIRLKLLGYPTQPPDNPSTYNQLTDLLPGQAILEQSEFAFWLLQVLTFGLIKLEVIFFYRRVFLPSGSTFNTLSWILIAICSLWTLGFFLTQVLSCGRKPWLYWASLAESDSVCINGLNFLLAMSASDLATDVMVFFLPFPIVWGLHTPMKRKLKLSLAFLVGAVSLVASAFRLSIHIGQRQAGHARKIDLFQTFTLTFYWCILEAGIALIAVNLFALNQLFGFRSIQSVVGSVRSILSLQSLKSATRDDTDRAGNTMARESQKGSESQEPETRTHSGTSGHSRPALLKDTFDSKTS